MPSILVDKNLRFLLYYGIKQSEMNFFGAKPTALLDIQEHKTLDEGMCE